MKVSDLVPREQKELASKTGKDLAKMYHQGGFKIPNFRDFMERPVQPRTQP